MSRESALVLANYLANSTPEPGESFDAYMEKAIGLWPDLTAAEIEWACARAAGMYGRSAEQLAEEADELEVAQCQHE